MREILATVKLDTRKDFWGSMDQIARSLATIAIPIILAVVGWRVEARLRSVATNQEYVKLAVSVLTQPVSDTEDRISVLRPWAVDLLQAHSPVKIPPEAATQLAAGTIRLPLSGPCFPQVDGYGTVEPRIAKVGQPVVFTGYGLGGDHYYLYTWGGDDGLSGQTKSVTHTYSTPGNKSATVKITSNGQNIYKTVEVIVESER